MNRVCGFVRVPAEYAKSVNCVTSVVERRAKETGEARTEKKEEKQKGGKAKAGFECRRWKRERSDQTIRRTGEEASCFAVLTGGPSGYLVTTRALRPKLDALLYVMKDKGKLCTLQHVRYIYQVMPTCILAMQKMAFYGVAIPMRIDALQSIVVGSTH